MPVCNATALRTIVTALSVMTSVAVSGLSGASAGADDYTRPAVFDVTDTIINPDLQAFSASIGPVGNGSWLLREGGAFEPVSFRNRYIAAQDSPHRIYDKPRAISRYDTLREGALDGAQAYVYRVADGRLALVRKDRVADGGHRASGWQPLSPDNRILTGASFATQWYDWNRPGVPTYFAVRAVDKAGRRSEPSQVIRFTRPDRVTRTKLPAPQTVKAPKTLAAGPAALRPPQGLQGAVAANGVLTLTWSAEASGDLAASRARRDAGSRRSRPGSRPAAHAPRRPPRRPGRSRSSPGRAWPTGERRARDRIRARPRARRVRRRAARASRRRPGSRGPASAPEDPTACCRAGRRRTNPCRVEPSRARFRLARVRTSAPFRQFLPRQLFVRAAAVAALSLMATGCNLALMPESYMNNLGAQSYQEMTSQAKVITGTAESRLIEEVGKKIAAATGKDFDWEFKLFDAPKTVNAFCLPGGKIAFYTGILPVARDENGDLEQGVAAIMGHEIAHAILQHGNKRMTQGLGINLAMEGVSMVLGNWGGASDATKQELMKYLGAGAQYGIVLPFGRGHETEADIEGIRYAIRAGYDPYAAPALWERMAKLYPNSGPEFASTHPASERRAADLRAAIPRLIEEERGRN